MPDPRSATHPVPDSAYVIARELHGILPFGARADALTRCPRLAERIDGADGAVDRTGDGTDGAAVLLEAIESFGDAVHLPDRHPEPLTPALVRRMLHVLLATRDLGWPGTDAPLSVRRVAAADLFFDATQTVLSDDDWKGPDGVEFALLTALAERVWRTTTLRSTAPDPPAGPDVEAAGRTREPGGERLGHLRRTGRPHGL